MNMINKRKKNFQKKNAELDAEQTEPIKLGEKKKWKT